MSRCPIHKGAPMRPGKPWPVLFSSEFIRTLKCTVCAYHCRDQAPVKHPSSKPESEAA